MLQINNDNKHIHVLFPVAWSPWREGQQLQLDTPLCTALQHRSISEKAFYMNGRNSLKNWENKSSYLLFNNFGITMIWVIKNINQHVPTEAR